MNALIPRWSKRSKVVIGMLHLLPLPGAPLYGGNVQAIRDALYRDVEALVEGGVDGLMMENFGDVPFFPGRVPAITIAQITSLAMDLRRMTSLPLGINVLRNDGQTALAIAQAVGAQYIRVNVLSGARVTDQGVVQGIAHDLLRERVALGAAEIKILADVDVKHSAPLVPRPLQDEVDDTLERGLADGLIVSGAGTGKATDPSKVQAVRRAAPDAPLFLGSGVSDRTIGDYLDHADGFIVGTWFKRGGIAANEVDASRVKLLMKLTS